MDVDGVLTDGVIHIDQNGQEIKNFHALDGLGITLAKSAGIKIIWISARQSKALNVRAKELKVDALYQNQNQKVQAFEDLLRKFSLKPSQVCYIGDDLVDIPVLKKAGFPVAVSNAAFEVKKMACYTTTLCGGKGAVREVIELVMKNQGSWEKAIKNYL